MHAVCGDERLPQQTDPSSALLRDRVAAAMRELTMDLTWVGFKTPNPVRELLRAKLVVQHELAKRLVFMTHEPASSWFTRLDWAYLGTCNAGGRYGS